MHRELKGLRKESAILLRIQSHPNIIQLIGVCENPRKYTLLLEYIDGGCLSEVLRSADPSIESWANRLDVAKQIAQGMAHLHSQSPPVFHLDLKPQNVLLKKANNAYTCKITDFGLSRMRGISIGSRTSRHSTYSTDSIPSGTVLYIAPERYNSTESTARPLLLAKADVYSFGVILWEIKERKQPFQNEPLTAVLHQRVKLGNGIPPGFAWAPAGYGSLQQNSSARDPCDRPTFFVLYLQTLWLICKISSQCKFPRTLVSADAESESFSRPLLTNTNAKRQLNESTDPFKEQRKIRFPSNKQQISHLMKAPASGKYQKIK
eukprot:m.106583 g.106583  ORF g.106583 m.106583 type:complete len:320 (+) comp37262_c0_seq38:536-1495(+)